MSRLAVWFDIPVTDMGRAVTFYERVTEQKLRRMAVGPEKEWLRRIEAAGGKVLAPRTPIGEDRGFFAYFEDSEGNRVGLHGRA